MKQGELQIPDDVAWPVQTRVDRNDDFYPQYLTDKGEWESIRHWHKNTGGGQGGYSQNWYFASGPAQQCCNRFKAQVAAKISTLRKYYFPTAEVRAAFVRDVPLAEYGLLEIDRGMSSREGYAAWIVLAGYERLVDDRLNFVEQALYIWGGVLDTTS